LNPAVDRFLALAISQQGAPYIWAGKGEYVAGRRHTHKDAHGVPLLVFDCSGLVTWCLRRLGWQSRVEMNAHRMWTLWRRTDKPQPGDLILYGKPSLCSHVEIVMPDGRFFGAMGGGSKTTSPTAIAKVQYRWKPRADVLGYVINPLRPDDDSQADTDSN
jgi:cell wall-associated NlpC family hydrolase